MMTMEGKDANSNGFPLCPRWLAGWLAARSVGRPARRPSLALFAPALNSEAAAAAARCERIKRIEFYDINHTVCVCVCL